MKSHNSNGNKYQSHERLQSIFEKNSRRNNVIKEVTGVRSLTTLLHVTLFSLNYAEEIQSRVRNEGVQRRIWRAIAKRLV